MTWLSDKHRDGISVFFVTLVMIPVVSDFTVCLRPECYCLTLYIRLLLCGQASLGPLTRKSSLFFAIPWPFASKCHPLLWLLLRGYFFVYIEPMWSFSFKRNKCGFWTYVYMFVLKFYIQDLQRYLLVFVCCPNGKDLPNFRFPTPPRKTLLNKIGLKCYCI